MKILITGGCGFLGTNLAAEVLARGHDLVVFDNLSRLGSAANREWLRGEGVFEYVHGDIRVSSDVERVVDAHRPDVVFHLAGQVAMTTSLANPRHDFEVNAYGTVNLLEAVRTRAPEALVIYSSTNKVYGDLDTVEWEERETRYVAPQWPGGFDEGLPFDPTTPYGCSKAAADTYMRDYARFHGVRTIVFRHSSMYGPRQFATFDQGWIGWFCQKALEQAAGGSEPFTIAGDGKQVRDVLHADDLTALYFAAIEHAEHATGRAFNIGGGMANSLSLRELFALLGESLEIRRPGSTRPWQHVLEPLRGYLMLAEACVADPRAFAEPFNFGPREADVVSVGEVMTRFVRAWGEGAAWRDVSQGDTGPHEAGLLKLDSSKAWARLGWRPHTDLSTCLEMTARWSQAFLAGADVEALRALTAAQIDEAMGV